MKHSPVRSSNIESIGYDSDDKILEVRFKGGGVYSYSDVPADEHQALMNAKSIGSHFHSNIRNNYPFTKM